MNPRINAFITMADQLSPADLFVGHSSHAMLSDPPFQPGILQLSFTNWSKFFSGAGMFPKKETMLIVKYLQLFDPGLGHKRI